jgi:hypothetical protein
MIDLMKLGLDLETKGQKPALDGLRQVEAQGAKTAGSLGSTVTNAKAIPPAMGQINGSMVGVAARLAGVNPALATFVSGLGSLSLGPLGVASLAVAGVGALVAAYRVFTKDAREAAKEQEKLTKAWRDGARAAADSALEVTRAQFAGRLTEAQDGVRELQALVDNLRAKGGLAAALFPEARQAALDEALAKLADAEKVLRGLLSQGAGTQPPITVTSEAGGPDPRFDFLRTDAAPETELRQPSDEFLRRIGVDEGTLTQIDAGIIAEQNALLGRENKWQEHVANMQGIVGEALGDTFADVAFEALSGSSKRISAAAAAGLGRVFMAQGKALVLASIPLKAAAKFLTNPFTAGFGSAIYGAALIALGATFTKLAQAGAGGEGSTVGVPTLREPNQTGPGVPDELVRTRIPTGSAQASSALGVGTGSPLGGLQVLGWADPRAQEYIALGTAAGTRRGL